MWLPATIIVEVSVVFALFHLSQLINVNKQVSCRNKDNTKHYSQCQSPNVTFGHALAVFDFRLGTTAYQP